jgi:hypothetical protein
MPDEQERVTAFRVQNKYEFDFKGRHNPAQRLAVDRQTCWVVQ